MTVIDEPSSDTASPASKGARTRQAILAAAIARFGRDGYRTTSVADIARDANVGGTVAYTYFPNKESLFLAAVDEDAAGLIRTGLDHLESVTDPEWRHTLLFYVADAVNDHPLAKRLLAGLEPEVTERVLELPALADLRRAVTDRLRSEQAQGRVRADVDPELIGPGLVAIVLSLLMSIVQVGGGTALQYAAAVDAAIRSAVEPTLD